MNFTIGEESWRRIEVLLKRLLAELNGLRSRLGKVEQDAVQQRQNPSDFAQTVTSSLAYVTTEIGVRTSANPGTGAARLVDHTKSPFQWRSNTDPPVAVGVNFTGGKQELNTYCWLDFQEGVWVLKAGDCFPGTYNGAKGTAPPVNRTVATSQSGQVVTSQSGQPVATG